MKTTFARHAAPLLSPCFHSLDSLAQALSSDETNDECVSVGRSLTPFRARRHIREDRVGVVMVSKTLLKMGTIWQARPSQKAGIRRIVGRGGYQPWKPAALLRVGIRRAFCACGSSSGMWIGYAVASPP
jgi:hypothetical protein